MSDCRFRGATTSQGEGAHWGHLPGIDIDLLHQGSHLGLTSWRCHGAHLKPAHEKFQERLVVCFQQGGSYLLRRAGRTAVVDANVVVYFNPQEPFTSVHPFGCGDFGCSLVVEPALLAEILTEHAPETLDARGPVFPIGLAACPPRAYLLLSLLAGYLRSHPAAEPLLVEETALHLAAEVIARPIRAGAKRRTENERQQRPDGDVSEEIKRQLVLHLETGISLPELAKKVGYSPFSVCRIFKRATGMTVHRYLMALRLRAAIGSVVEGSDLTRVALDLGYSSHSHFTARFRREFGLTPSALRALRGHEESLRRGGSLAVSRSGRS